MSPSDDPAIKRIYNLKYRELNKDKLNEYDKKRYYEDRAGNPEYLEYQKEYRIENADRIKEQRSLYRKQPHVIKHTAAKSLEYRLRKRQAVPEWADLNYIYSIYKNCPIGHEVDHIVPLHGKIVCGLHVEYNLQYLTVEENKQKRNYFPYKDYE